MEDIKNNINNLEEINKENYEELIKLLNEKLDNQTKTQKKLSLKESHRKYYQNNKERILEKQHKYNDENKDKIKVQQKEYRLRKKEEMKPIIEAKRLEKQRIKAEKEAEKQKNKRPVGRPRKQDNELKYPRKEPKIIKDEKPEEAPVIKPIPVVNKPKRGRPKKY